MAAAVTGFILLLFLLLQFLQGVLLNLLLEVYVPAVGGLNQYLWVIADGFLLIATLVYYCTLRGKGGQSALRHEFCGVPALAMAWAVYLVIVLLPRTIWVMVHAGRCLGKAETRNSTSTIADLAVASGLSIQSLDQNFLVTTVSAGTTGLLVLLTMAQQSEHGLLRRGVALDFDIAEAAFGTIDGVEYWQPFFDAASDDCCAKTGICSVNSTMTPTCADAVAQDAPLVKALDGPVGYLLIFVASTSFILPFFAIWQLQKKSTAIRQQPTGGGGADGGGGGQEETRGMVALEVTYMLFDLFCINIPGFALRMYLWQSLDQVITALVTKNVLGIIFRLLLVWVKYIQPRIRKYTGRGTVHPQAAASPSTARRHKEKWTRPARAAKVADSFMTSAEGSGRPRSTRRRHEDDAAAQRTPEVSTASTKSIRHQQVWHSSSLETNAPIYPSPPPPALVIGSVSSMDEDNLSDRNINGATLTLLDPLRPSSSSRTKVLASGSQVSRQSHLDIEIMSADDNDGENSDSDQEDEV